MDAHPTQNFKDRNLLFSAHIRELRANRWTRNAHLILMCERNTGHESGNLKQILDQYPNTSAYNQPSKGKKTMINNHKGQMSDDIIEYFEQCEKNPGFTTDFLLKNQALVALRAKLVRNLLFYSDSCISSNPFLIKHNAKERFHSHKIELEDQMKRAKEYPTSQQKMDTQRVKMTWSAKTNNNGEIQSGYNDDMLVMLAISCHLWDIAMSGYEALPGFPYDQINWKQINDDEF